jgi:hypothetical protein
MTIETSVAGVSVIVITEDADLLPFACATAVTLTLAGFGTFVGAVYIPVEEIVPIVGSPPLVPFTCQETLVLAELRTVAVNCCVFPGCSVADVGEITTAISGRGF